MEANRSHLFQKRRKTKFWLLMKGSNIFDGWEYDEWSSHGRSANYGLNADRLKITYLPPLIVSACAAFSTFFFYEKMLEDCFGARIVPLQGIPPLSGS